MKKIYAVLIIAILLLPLGACTQSVNLKEERVISTDNVEKNSKKIVGCWFPARVPKVKTKEDREFINKFRNEIVFDENGKCIIVSRRGVTLSEKAYRVINDEQIKHGTAEKQIETEYSFENGRLLLYWLGTKKSGAEPVVYKRIYKAEFGQESVTSVGSFDVGLTAKDVQYNMSNNVNREFLVSGIATLDDYYNYGFDSSIERKYFCVNIRQKGGSYSDSWYLYFHREGFKELFHELKQSEKNITVIATIPSSRFKERQGRMAEVIRARWH